MVSYPPLPTGDLGQTSGKHRQLSHLPGPWGPRGPRPRDTCRLPRARMEGEARGGCQGSLMEEGDGKRGGSLRRTQAQPANHSHLPTPSSTHRGSHTTPSVPYLHCSIRSVNNCLLSTS